MPLGLAIGVIVASGWGGAQEQRRPTQIQRPTIRPERVEISAAFGSDVLVGAPAAHRKLAVLVVKADGSPLTGLQKSNFHIVWAVGSGTQVGGGGYTGFDWATTMRPALVNTDEPGIYGFDLGASGGPTPSYTGYKISVNFADREHGVHYQGATLLQVQIPKGD